MLLQNGRQEHNRTSHYRVRISKVLWHSEYKDYDGKVLKSYQIGLRTSRRRMHSNSAYELLTPRKRSARANETRCRVWI